MYTASIPVPMSMIFRLKPVDSGLCIVSRYPIIFTDYIIYSQGTAADRFACKGALYVLLKLRDSPNGTDDNRDKLQIITSHMQASYDSASDSAQKSQGSVRASQVTELKQFMNQYRTKYPETPMVLLGDLNVNSRKSVEDGSDSEEYLQFVEQLKFDDGPDMIDLLRECNNGLHPPTCNDIIRDENGNFKKPYVRRETALSNLKDDIWPKCLDYIFYIPPSARNNNNDPNKEQATPDKGTSRVEEFFVEGKKYTQLSDHYGVSTVLKIPK